MGRGGCSQLSSLPESVGWLTALQQLFRRCFSRPTSLPESFGQLLALQHLNLSECSKLSSLPESFGQLSALQHLTLSYCRQLSSLPVSFGQLSALQHLDLSGCSQLYSLPESIGQLSALRHMGLAWSGLTHFGQAEGRRRFPAAVPHCRSGRLLDSGVADTQRQSGHYVGARGAAGWQDACGHGSALCTRSWLGGGGCASGGQLF